MPGCVLRVDGAGFDPQAFLATSALVADVVYHRGDRRSATSSYDTGGFTVVVSEADGNQVGEQISDAIRFLDINRDELTRLSRFPGVEAVSLDFGCEFLHERVASRFYRLPVALLRACADLGVEIELSVYAAG